MISEESFRWRLKIFNYDVDNPNSSLKNFTKVRIWDKIQAEAYQYCQENFGDNWIWSSPFQTNYTDIYFLSHESALLFTLRFDTITT